MLHTCRRFEYCKDAVLLVSEATPADCINHLKERNYRFIVAGQDKADIKHSLEFLNEQLGLKKILTDTGMVLGNLLLNLQLV
ncbi:MAG: hypothetical protein GYA41_10525 [Bacteroidales bacterium]|nr:hypothetical protein [Bacteroidales bacterium]